MYRALQPFDDARCLFFLVSKLPDKNLHLSSLSLFRAFTYFVSKNIGFSSQKQIFEL